MIINRNKCTSSTSLMSRLSTAELVKLVNKIFLSKLIRTAMIEAIVVVFPVPGYPLMSK